MSIAATYRQLLAQRPADAAARRRVRLVDRRLAVPRRARRPGLRAHRGPGAARASSGRRGCCRTSCCRSRRASSPIASTGAWSSSSPTSARAVCMLGAGLARRHERARSWRSSQWRSSPTCFSHVFFYPAIGRSSRAWSATSASSGRPTRPGRRLTTSPGSSVRRSRGCCSRQGTLVAAFLMNAASFTLIAVILWSLPPARPAPRRRRDGRCVPAVAESTAGRPRLASDGAGQGRRRHPGRRFVGLRRSRVSIDPCHARRHDGVLGIIDGHADLVRVRRDHDPDRLHRHRRVPTAATRQPGT